MRELPRGPLVKWIGPDGGWKQDKMEATVACALAAALCVLFLVIHYAMR